MAKSSNCLPDCFALVALFLSWTTPGFVDYQSWRVNDMLTCTRALTSSTSMLTLDPSSESSIYSNNIVLEIKS
ncbi:hypothetical protein HZ326_0598 [Fusarium oxysporum f. sp. albedinis]|nr:hypothetical protein HZ326_0598 [Fusarium oxysporum f. sp. albedinis]